MRMQKSRLLLLPLCLVAAWPPPVAAQSPTAPAATGPDVFDAARDSVRSTAEWLARSVDSWFGDRPFEEGGKVTDGRVVLNLLHRRDEGTEFSLRFNARFRLPNVERSTYLFLGRDDERELVTDTPAAFTRQDRLQSERRAERSFFAGLGYDWRENVDFRLGLRGGLKPYAQARFHQRWPVGQRGLVEFRETLFWTLADHLGSTTALSYERPFSRTLALRWLSAATITQRSKEFDWSSDLGLIKDFGSERRGSVEGIVNGLTGSGVAVREWGVQTRWQQPLHRSWLHGELIVGRFWARPDAAARRQAVWALGLGMKMRF
ncbi:hypothetical protein HLB44_28960 [Aquincola sp. S2]|uniref:DUF481 domain-containing protein n=1 Tax=Pseudaquabacterium terrae TaxID=2732868 RepID=A0ABX2EQP3_9BURK|nr:hypothetical protein [Aquabacterium terrae]NRF71040.1 hypothetical protein [Aquabacterium terrae]